jgi:hypothetical protein
MKQVYKTSLLVLIGLLAALTALDIMHLFSPECRGSGYSGSDDVPCYMSKGMAKGVGMLVVLGLGFHYVQKLPAK